MRSVGWWMGPIPVNRLELPKFKEARRNCAAVPKTLLLLSLEVRGLLATDSAADLQEPRRMPARGTA